MPRITAVARFTSWLASLPVLVRLSLSVGAIFLVLFAVDAAVAFRHGPSIRQAGWDGAIDGATWVVRQVSADGPAAGRLQPGDVITAFNGDPSILAVPPDKVLHTLPQGPYRLKVANTGDVALQLTVTRRPILYAQITESLLLSLAFFVTGMLIALYKPDDGIGWRAWASSLACASYIAYVASTPTGISDVRGIAAWVPNLFQAVFPLHFVACYRFLSVFPVAFPPSRRRRLMERTLVGGGLAVWALGVVFVASTMLSLDQLRRVSRAVPEAFKILNGIQFAQWLFMGFPIVATVTVCIVNYRKLRDAAQRRRIRWVFVGTVVSAVPMIVTTACFVVWQAMGIANQMQPVLAVLSGISNLLLAAFPISIAYAVLKHRVLGIQVVVRRGVQYLLAANALRLLIALPILGLAAGIVANPNRTVAQLLFEGPAKWNLVLIAVVIAGLRYRASLREAIDRKFFRESYNQERILADLVTTMTQADSVRALCAAVTRQLEAALHPERAQVYIYEKHEMTLAHSSVSAPVLPSLPAHCEAFDLLAKLGGAISWSDFTQAQPDDRYWKPLQSLEAELLVPILSTSNKLVGLIALGPKKSEEPYTGRDKKLLDSVAAQIGVLQENLSLRSMVNVQKTVERDVLARLGGQQINIVRECPKCGRCYSATTALCEADGVELTLSVPVEHTIDGRYRLDRLLGRGGMGAVYAALDLRLNRAVAIKVMKGGLFGDASAVRRFSREAQAAARLNHPNIVRIFDFGPLLGEGAYQVLELVAGHSWRAELIATPQWSPQYAVPLFKGVLDGLACAHEAGIVHRDLKPENVLLAPTADSDALTARILDFGLAKIRSEEMGEDTNVTRPGTVVGTYGYMSSEQFSGAEVDARTDIYSFGVMLLETLTGPLPLKAFNVHEQIQQLLKTRFEFEEATSAHLAVRDVIAKAVALERMTRYASAGELAAELAPALANCPPLPDRRAQLASKERAVTATMYKAVGEGKGMQ